MIEKYEDTNNSLHRSKKKKTTSSPFNAFVRDRILNLPREPMIGLPGDLTLHDWSRGFL